MVCCSRRLITVACCTILLISPLFLYRISSDDCGISCRSKSIASSRIFDKESWLNHLTNVTTPWKINQSATKFAYAQYATDLDYLCNVIINFSQLEQFGTEMGMALIYPDSWNDKGSHSKEAAAIEAIRTHYPHVNLRPFEILTTSKGDPTWRQSLTKFHSFHLTEYSRVLIFDSDSLVLNQMDNYFLAPPAVVAVPRAYWLGDGNAEIKDQMMASHVMLIEPSQKTYDRIINEVTKSGDFDMEVVNTMFKSSAMILPHRHLALLSGEFRSTDHSKYLSEAPDEEWNAMAEVNQAYLIHFSDWPLPKPWRAHTAKEWDDARPRCDPVNVEKDKAKGNRPECADQLVWTSVYEKYQLLKDEKCGILTSV